MKLSLGGERLQDNERRAAGLSRHGSKVIARCQADLTFAR
jgi:hypothetical protein